MTKRISIFILLLFLKVTILSAADNCTDLKNFKENYVKLLNDLKVEGRDVELNKDGHIVAKEPDKINGHELPGNKVEQELYKHYDNALIKIAKAFQFLNKDSQKDKIKLLKANDAVAAFFRVIDPLSNEELARNKEYKLYEFLEQMQKVEVEPLEFKLNATDKYFLTKLFTHSQDKICTLRNLHKNGNDVHDYLELTSNQIILSLKKHTKNDSLQLVNEDAAILNAIKKNMQQMGNIIKKPGCLEILKAQSNGKNLEKIFGRDRKIQACNYGLFLETLKHSDYDNFDTILHFINANKLAKDGRTGLDWITDKLVNQKIEPPSCTKNQNGSYTINDPSNSIDEALFSCDKGSVKTTGKECFDLFDIKRAPKKTSILTLKDPKNSNVDLSIENSIDCKKLKFGAPDSSTNTNQNQGSQDLTLTPCTKDNCEKSMNDDFKKIYSKLVWDEKELKCYGALVSDQKSTKLICSSSKKNEVSPPVTNTQPQTKEDECKSKNNEYIKNSDPGEGIKTDRYIWDGKTCVDKFEKNNSTQVQNEDNSSGNNLNAKQATPPRFIPINIPSRQMFVLPGMP